MQYEYGDMNPQYKFVYKVVRRLHNGSLVSAILGQGRVTYRINKWTITPRIFEKYGYYLCVFTNVQDAYLFAVDFPRIDMQVWKCAWQGLLLRSPPRMSFPHLILEDKLEYSYSHRWPNGTAMAKQIMLLERV